jgi:uncharacterized damage-inducible protein DinB
MGASAQSRKARRAVAVPGDVREVLLEIWAANELMNQFILERLDARAWRAKLPGRTVRTVAAIFAHVHNIRRKWLRLSAPHLKLPKELDRAYLTQKQAKAAFAESAQRCSEMLAGALATTPTRVRKLRRDGWAPSWPAGPTMIVYMFAHEAHHRGQVLMLAHQLGFPLREAYGIWNWEKLWKECGFRTRPR